MLKNFHNPFPSLVRVAQETSYYCGPAVLQMLINYQGTEIHQEDIVQASGIGHRIQQYGMTIRELATAAKVTTPHLQFWYKKYSTIGELSRIVNIYQYPVGVEWQGVFDYPDEEEDEDEDDDPGHYSIITKLDTKNNIVKIADPDKHYAGVDRAFSVLEFERRWWDINQIFNPFTGKNEEEDDFHVMFLVTNRQEVFPELFAMQRG